MTNSRNATSDGSGAMTNGRNATSHRNPRRGDVGASTRVQAAVPALLGIALLLGAGCSRGPAPGEPLTSAAFDTAAVANAGGDCAALEGMLLALKSESAQLRVRLETVDAETDTLRSQAVRASTQIRELNTLIRDLRLKEKAIHSYIVKGNENLRDIARTVWGDPTLWREIFEANRDQIGTEDAELREGMRLSIPRRDKS